MVIRDARPEDLREIVAIYNATIPGRAVTADLEPVSVESRVGWFMGHTPDAHPLWVAEDEDGGVAGWISLHAWHERAAYARTAEVSVFVREDQRRRGLAAGMLQAMLDRAPALGVAVILGLIFTHNEASVGLFERLGFERWGLLPQVTELDGVLRDVLILGRAAADPGP